MSDPTSTPSGLRESDLLDDPVEQFRAWFEAARATGMKEPTAVTLATADPRGRPSARTVLLKGYGAEGFRFFTNYDSRKGRELAANPHAALLLFWPALDRQIRLEGPVERLSPEDSDAYFASRPRGSRLGALASDQSHPLESREALEARLEELHRLYPDDDQPIPRPPHWGGFRLQPESFEFWQAGAARLHDRFVYRREEGGAWVKERLAP